MAAATASPKRALDSDLPLIEELALSSPRKKLKPSDLPLTQEQRATIDSLLYTFKKKGGFDELRKKIYKQFDEGDHKTALVNSLQELTDREIDLNPTLLSKDRRIAAPEAPTRRQRRR